MEQQSIISSAAKVSIEFFDIFVYDPNNQNCTTEPVTNEEKQLLKSYILWHNNINKYGMHNQQIYEISNKNELNILQQLMQQYAPDFVIRNNYNVELHMVYNGSMLVCNNGQMVEYAFQQCVDMEIFDNSGHVNPNIDENGLKNHYKSFSQTGAFKIPCYEIRFNPIDKTKGLLKYKISVLSNFIYPMKKVTINDYSKMSNTTISKPIETKFEVFNVYILKEFNNDYDVFLQLNKEI